MMVLEANYWLIAETDEQISTFQTNHCIHSFFGVLNPTAHSFIPMGRLMLMHSYVGFAFLDSKTRRSKMELLCCTTRLCQSETHTKYLCLSPLSSACCFN